MTAALHRSSPPLNMTIWFLGGAAVHRCDTVGSKPTALAAEVRPLAAVQSLLTGKHTANMLGSLAMARRRDPDEPPNILSAEELKALRQNLAHLSPDGVRQFHERAFEECRLIYTRIPSLRKMQTLVQVWKQLRKGRQMDLFRIPP